MVAMMLALFVAMALVVAVRSGVLLFVAGEARRGDEGFEESESVHS